MKKARLAAGLPSAASCGFVQGLKRFQTSRVMRVIAPPATKMPVAEKIRAM